MPEVIAPLDTPLSPEGGLAILYGNLAPNGAVIKHAAASPNLLQHRGRAVVFHSLEDMTSRVNDPDLDVRPEDVLILQGAGPVGGPGDARGRHDPHPEEAPVRGSPGYGPHL